MLEMLVPSAKDNPNVETEENKENSMCCSLTVVICLMETRTGKAIK